MIQYNMWKWHKLDFWGAEKIGIRPAMKTQDMDPAQVKKNLG